MHLNGSVSGVTTGKVYLQKFIDKYYVVVDSAKVQNGQFSFSTKTVLPEIYGISLDSKENPYMLFLDKNKTTVNLDPASDYQNTEVTGSALHARLKMDIEKGTDAIVDEVRNKAHYFRSLCKKNGWEVPAEVPSNCITGFFVHKNGDILFNELLKQDIYIMPGGTPHYFRVSHLGVQSKEDLDELAARIKEIENYKLN